MKVLKTTLKELAEPIIKELGTIKYDDYVVAYSGPNAEDYLILSGRGEWWFWYDMHKKDELRNEYSEYFESKKDALFYAIKEEWVLIKINGLFKDIFDKIYKARQERVK